jgi:hypothetical protein
MTTPVSKNARPRPGISLFLCGLDLNVEVSGPHILIAAPKGNFRVSYAKSAKAAQLVLESEWWTGRKQSASVLAAYRASAWRLANDMAAQLGWFDRK